MYENISEDYDRFNNWQARLSYEMPFLEKQLETLTFNHGKVAKILDTACGTGMHAIALAQKGFQVKGTDKYEEMVNKAYKNAEAFGVQIDFHTAGFGELTQTFGSNSFDSLLCLGNSLPHVLSVAELKTTLEDFNHTLKPGGLLIIQNRDFDKILEMHSRWMDPQAFTERPFEWVFQRFYDFEENGLIRFNMITLKRAKGESWQTKMNSTLLMPIMAYELITQLRECGFNAISTFGSLKGDLFNSKESENLVVTAQKQP